MWVLLLCFCGPDHAPFRPVQEAESACVREFRKVNESVREIQLQQRNSMVNLSKTRQLILGRFGGAELVEAESMVHTQELSEFDKRCANWVPLSPNPDEPEASWRQRAAVEEWRAHVSFVRQALIENARYHRVDLESKGAHAEAKDLWNKHLEKLKAYERANAGLLPKDGQ